MKLKVIAEFEDTETGKLRKVGESLNVGADRAAAMLDAKVVRVSSGAAAPAEPPEPVAEPKPDAEPEPVAGLKKSRAAK